MATLILKNGEQYRGVFSGAILEPSDLRYTLKMVKKVNSNTEQQSNGIVNTATEFLGVGDDHTMTFAVQDVAELAVSQLVIDRTQHKYNKGMWFLGQHISSSFASQMCIQYISDTNFRRCEYCI